MLLWKMNTLQMENQQIDVWRTLTFVLQNLWPMQGVVFIAGTRRRKCCRSTGCLVLSCVWAPGIASGSLTVCELENHNLISKPS